MGLLKELAENQNLVLEFERGCYKPGLLAANKLVSKKFNSICYVTVSRPASSIMADLKKEGVDLKKYRFIDCVSKKSGLTKPLKQTVFITTPNSLTEIGIAINKALNSKKVDLLFFDTISSLLIYNNELESVKFLHSLTVQIKGTKTKALYLIMKNDLSKKVVREIELFVDGITWLE